MPPCSIFQNEQFRNASSNRSPFPSIFHWVLLKCDFILCELGKWKIKLGGFANFVTDFLSSRSVLKFHLGGFMLLPPCSTQWILDCWKQESTEFRSRFRQIRVLTSQIFFGKVHQGQVGEMVCYFSQTWVFDNTTYTHIHPPTHPPTHPIHWG